jgi:hypothetical protein
MKKTLAVLLSSAAVCQAALIPMGISPAGTSDAIGLSPSNEVPAITTSTGSGGAISGGLVFDTDSNMLMVTLGYGSAAGFSDLTGPARSVTVNGPAATNENAAVLFDLSPFTFPAVNPDLGGVVFGNVNFPTNDVGDLLAGFDYINIGTDANTNGEIRGQIIPLVPTITCPEPSSVECGTPAVVPVQITNPSGYAMTVLWLLNGHKVQTNQIGASLGPIVTNVVFSAELPLGTNSLVVWVRDSAKYSTSCGTTVTVIDTIAPTISNAWTSVKSLWPPNHKMIPVTIKAKVTDNCGPAKWSIIQVESNEPVNGLGDGNTSSDWKILGPHTVALRAERSGNGDGRTYSITIQAKDASGNLSDPQTVTVTVPKSQGNGKNKDK